MTTSIQIVSRATNTAADTPEEIYESPERGEGTIITAFTATNTDTVNRYYRAYIVEKDGSVDNPQIKYRVVVWGELDLGTGIDGQVIPPGGKLYVESSEPNSIFFTVSGRETEA